MLKATSLASIELLLLLIRVNSVLMLGELMSPGLIEIGNLDVELTTRPIEPSWIIEGQPRAVRGLLEALIDGAQARADLRPMLAHLAQILSLLALGSAIPAPKR